MITISNIIAEADTLVPNGYQDADKIPWLNAINLEFFDVVKIPLVYTFQAIPGVASYILPDRVRSKNIDHVSVGTTTYLSMQFDQVLPGRGFWIFDENTLELTLYTAPKSEQPGVVRYNEAASSSFSTSDLNVYPDAPNEYHWIYVLGLAEYIAKASGRDGDAANYGGQYRAALQVAAQNYRRGDPS